MPMSRTRGMRHKRTGSFVSRQAAKAGRAEFFAPLIGDVACEGCASLDHEFVHINLSTLPQPVRLPPASRLSACVPGHLQAVP